MVTTNIRVREDTSSENRVSVVATISEHFSLPRPFLVVKHCAAHAAAGTLASHLSTARAH
jgi:hypothetical protein